MSLFGTFLGLFTLAEPPRRDTVLGRVLARVDKEVCEARDQVRAFILDPHTDARTVAHNVEKAVLNGKAKEESPAQRRVAG